MHYLVAMFEEVNDALRTEGNRSPPESSNNNEVKITGILKNQSSYPTEARMRGKMKSLVDKPKEAKKRKFEIENHFGDCGDSINGLSMSTELFTIYEDYEACSDDDDDLVSFAEEEFDEESCFASCLRGVADDDGAT
eukprot:5784175-Pyramimonas_sp.AAC.1